MMYHMHHGDERPVALDVDDLIFDNNEEWCASDR